MASVEEKVILLLAKVTDNINEINNCVNKSTRQNDTARFSTLALAQEAIEEAQRILDNIWDCLDEVVHGEADEDEIISSPYMEN